MNWLRKALGRNIGILILRVTTAAMMLCSHGISKLMNFSELSTSFADPLGIGTMMSLVLALGAEVFCSLLVMLGLFTRLAVIPLMITMLVAAFIVHIDDPWQKKEFALLYFIPFLALFFTGPGAYSVDAVIGKAD